VKHWAQALQTRYVLYSRDVPNAPVDEMDDSKIASALLDVVGPSRWEVVALARAYISWKNSDANPERQLFEASSFTLRRSKELIDQFGRQSLVAAFKPRERIGSAENPITKLFPAAFAEQLFVEELDSLAAARSGLEYSDDRYSGYQFVDFTLKERADSLPINVKNAGTRFLNAEALVELKPDDCVPIPAYKAYGALETLPNLLYAVCPDYELTTKLEAALPSIFTENERMVWQILNRYAGAHLRDAEDRFVSSIIARHWSQLKAIATNTNFFVVSARKAIRVLQTKPQRTPGLGLRAWGTSARGEVNVHLSIKEDMTPWREVRDRIESKGLSDIISAVNRRRQEWVYDPEI
jgi:hypothetical protein